MNSKLLSILVSGAILIPMPALSQVYIFSQSSTQSQSTASECGDASNSTSVSTGRTGATGVGGRHAVGTSVNICVNGVSVGTGTNIIVDEFGSSSSSVGTSAACLGDVNNVHQHSNANVFGDGDGSAAAAGAAACD